VSTRERLEACFDEAREARRANDVPRLLSALRAGLDLARASEEASLVATAAWRLSKAEHDHGSAAAALEALRPLLIDPPTLRDNLWTRPRPCTPFEFSATTVDAVPELVRRYGDHEGYGPSLVPLLWTAWTAWYAERGEAVMAAWGRVEAAWPAACRGEVAATADVLARTEQLSAADLHGARRRHARADDVPGSLPWLHLDAARTALCAATWAGEERAAWDAREALLDATAQLGASAAEDPWTVDAITRADDRFGWPGQEQRTIWLRALPGRADTFGALARATTARWSASPGWADALADAAKAAEDARIGPEWAAQAWRELSVGGDDRAIAELDRLNQRYATAR
jgi:hypothetical protein